LGYIPTVISLTQFRRVGDLAAPQYLKRVTYRMKEAIALAWRRGSYRLVDSETMTKADKPA
jgi:hypothetical protein